MQNCKKVAIYIRIGNADNEKNLSIDFQKKQITSYYNDNTNEEFEYYIDNGYSGNDFERPALQKLIKDAQEQKLSRCIVYTLDRLSRSAKDTLHIINNILTPNGIDFISLIGNLDTSTSMGKHIIDLYSMVNSTKRGRVICQRTKR